MKIWSFLLIYNLFILSLSNFYLNSISHFRVIKWFFLSSYMFVYKHHPIEPWASKLWQTYIFFNSTFFFQLHYWIYIFINNSNGNKSICLCNYILTPCFLFTYTVPLLGKHLSTSFHTFRCIGFSGQFLVKASTYVIII